MKIASINYGRTVNLGNYESARLDVTINIAPDESTVTLLATLKEKVETECKLIVEEHRKGGRYAQ